MIRSSSLRSLSILAVGLSFAAAAPAARAENPLERLHRHIAGKIFGHHDRRDDDDDRREKRRDDRDYDRRDDDRYRGNASGWYPQNRPHVEYRTYERSYSYERPYEAPRTYSQSRALEVEVQVALQRRGYYRGNIDGDLGPESRAAIRHFQFDHDLPASGRIDRELLSALRF